ncbi:MAG: protein-L-isoaspartate(D-aspartate) O-methyltransferase [Candidatus Hydrothermarchaeales archaeon]
MKIPKRVFENRIMRGVLLTLVVVLLLSLILYPKEAGIEEENRTIEGREIISDEGIAVQREDPSLTEARRRMVERDLKGRDIVDEKVLEVMGRIPRHEFVDESLKGVAYADNPLPIGEGQTISQPYVVALMTQSLNIERGERVLEIGTGSGYQAAVLAELTDEIYTIEIREKLARSAEERLKSLGYKNVKVRHADGYFGWEEYAPFDAIIVTAAVNHIPPPLIAQLNDGGRLVLPLGSTTYFQTLTLIHKKGGNLTAEHITSVRFVPMIGEAEKKG